MGVGGGAASIEQGPIACVTDGKTVHFRYRSGYTDVGPNPWSMVHTYVENVSPPQMVGSKMLLLNQATWLADSFALGSGWTLIKVIVLVSVWDRDQYCDIDDIRIV